ncbi:MAG: hypothetical protein DI587_06760 [Variovorax paradoxus]|jgi:hypothetical protein|nr:MAG: hypothetical protein DI583_06760 [Variovorax paradoxus]PZQ13950.1 MAG: hypothetical protein DI587_06760 [Variovorax paradoxus]
MSAALLVALCCTGALLLTTAYFFLGAVPLLTLRHDTPMDARFVRGFFNTYYLAAISTAGATALSCAVAGRPAFALEAAAIALLAVLLRRTVLSRMDALRARVEAGATDVAAAFRRIHGVALLANFGQLVAIVWTLVAASMP